MICFEYHANQMNDLGGVQKSKYLKKIQNGRNKTLYMYSVVPESRIQQKLFLILARVEPECKLPYYSTTGFPKDVCLCM